jgi:hypothetical protein
LDRTWDAGAARRRLTEPLRLVREAWPGVKLINFARQILFSHLSKRWVAHSEAALGPCLAPTEHGEHDVVVRLPQLDPILETVSLHVVPGEVEIQQLFYVHSR